MRPARTVGPRNHRHGYVRQRRFADTDRPGSGYDADEKLKDNLQGVQTMEYLTCATEQNTKNVYTFYHPEFGRLRVYEDYNGELHFSLEDVARALGITVNETLARVRDISKAVLQ